MKLVNFSSLESDEKRLFIAKAALVVAICISCLFFAVSACTSHQRTTSDIDATTVDELAETNSEGVSSESINAASQGAQQATSDSQQSSNANTTNSSANSGATANKTSNNGNTGATSVDSDANNVVDAAQTADNSFIYDTSIASLADESDLYDDRTIQVMGEVVGDRLSAGKQNYYWITVEAQAKNDSSTISCYVSDSLASKVDTYGRYNVTGSIVQVRGVYHAACDEHDGLADIHVGTLEVTTPGVTQKDSFNFLSFLPGIFLVLLGFGMVYFFRVLRERMM